MNAFIVRPFGTKSGIDFNRVESDLIAPALAELGVHGATTEEIARAGNIRADMFDRLAKAHLVIADISIHNANVFYELGARHALRDKRTFLIRSKADDVPFDIKTDRYLAYDAAEPGDSVQALVEGLRQTLGESHVDSPIFSLVPGLKPQDWSRLAAVPEEFQVAVERAISDKHAGDLELFSTEARVLPWGGDGLRQIARAEFDLGCMQNARTDWEFLRDAMDGDLEADIMLATAYQKLGDLAASDAAVERVLSHSEIDNHQRAEALALKGRNHKDRWRASWRKAAPDARAQAALTSVYLRDALHAYRDGFNADLNHYFSGINALALLKVMLELAHRYPDTWDEMFDEDKQAAAALEDYQDDAQALEGAVRLAVRRDLDISLERGKLDPWARLTQADLALLTSTRPGRIATRFRRALENARPFHFESARNQLALYRELQVLVEPVAAAMSVVQELQPSEVRRAPSPHYILFAGHRIDSPGRSSPRFPAEMESVARAAIQQAVEQEKARVRVPIFGIAGGANGGDLLFHEICAELTIPTTLYLVIPEAPYIAASVALEGAPAWIDRFHAVRETSDVRLLQDREELPDWLKDRPRYSVWQRNTLWCLYNALAGGPENVTVIVLWDGAEGDGPGGTKDMVEQARERGAKVVHLNTEALFETG